jgi:hypothetical protein
MSTKVEMTTTMTAMYAALLGSLIVPAIGPSPRAPGAATSRPAAQAGCPVGSGGWRERPQAVRSTG